MEFSKVIERINFLYHKSKNEGLNEEELNEQKELRSYYIQVIKGNFKANLNNVDKINKK